MRYSLKRLNLPKLYEPRNLPVSWDTSATDSPRGIYGPILKFRNSQLLYRAEANVYSSTYLLLRFYPPSHFLSIFRKTKPAFNVKSTNSKSYIDECGSYLKNIYDKRKSVVPSSYAVWRRKATLLVKKAFIEEWTALKGPKGVADTILAEASMDNSESITVPLTPVGIAKDGFYEFVILKYPNNPEENELIRKDVSKAVQKVANLEWEDLLKVRVSRKTKENKPFNQHSIVGTPTWVDLINQKLKFKQFNALMKNSSIPFELKPIEIKRMK